ncbi:unnamed protein product [Effrenium voratum]|uniref:Uncharacterized protein n=1 Tax=Effrenium voratum TaxID=2562239 RepID=A0AA36HXX2_9DINO|nr:unnamed protein product [Effrenium voratum]
MPFADESQIGSMNFARPVRGDPRVRAVGLVVCVGFLVALLRGGHLAHLALGVVVLLTLASSASRRLRPQRSKVHFSPQVECMGVPNLLIVEEQRKAQLWWQPEDFADFLKVRLEIAKAYKDTAHVG